MEKQRLFSELDRPDTDESAQDVVDELRTVEVLDEEDDDRDEGEGSGELVPV
jgi:hypothetical protein